MEVGDLVRYGANLGPQWKKKHVGVVVEVSEFIRVIFPLAPSEKPNWFHPDNLEAVDASR